jgi:hypothetical protein
MSKHQAVPDAPGFTPGPWLSRRLAAKRVSEEKGRLELERRKRLCPERPRREAYDTGAVERWVNWTIGSLLVALLLSRLH